MMVDVVTIQFVFISAQQDDLAKQEVVKVFVFGVKFEMGYESILCVELHHRLHYASDFVVLHKLEVVMAVLLN